MRRVHKLQHRWHRYCSPGAQAELNRLGVCVHETCTRSTAVTTSRTSLSVENYQDISQRSTRGEAGLKVRRQEYGQLFGMVFQAPHQSVALQQANLRNRTRVAAAITWTTTRRPLAWVRMMAIIICLGSLLHEIRPSFLCRAEV